MKTMFVITYAVIFCLAFFLRLAIDGREEEFPCIHSLSNTVLKVTTIPCLIAIILMPA